jgi:anti-sigma regulatory factor (Ser/Thr protein kinase)
MTQIPANIRYPANIGSLEPLMSFVRSCLQSQGIGPERVGEIELAMEEILVNVFNYAYPDRTGDVEVACRLDNGEGLLVEVLDQGVAFDPLTLVAPDLEGDIAERPIGGLGVFFVRRLIPGIRYRREEGRNILTLPIAAEPLL